MEMVNPLIELVDLFDRYDEWKEKRAKMNPSCPDCGFWKACEPCSERYSRIDVAIRLKEGKPVDEYLLKRYGPNSSTSN